MSLQINSILMKNIRIGCIFDEADKNSIIAFEKLKAVYNITNIGKNPDAEIDYIISIGGDGLMLKTLHLFQNKDIKIYGLNMGTVGFLLNDFLVENLTQRIQSADSVILYPLKMTVHTADNKTVSAHAFNEISLLRQTNQIAKIRVIIDGTTRIEELSADGILIATPAGSTAYNVAVNGPILPLDANLMALTPISPFRPRKWPGALLPHNCQLEFQILQNTKRSVSAVADSFEVRNITKVSVNMDLSVKNTLLFDSSANFREKVFKEQFLQT